MNINKFFFSKTFYKPFNWFTTLHEYDKINFRIQFYHKLWLKQYQFHMNSLLTSISTYHFTNYYEKTAKIFLCHWTCWYDNVILLIWLLANTKIIIISRPQTLGIKLVVVTCHCCSLVVLSWYDNVKFQAISIQGEKIQVALWTLWLWEKLAFPKSWTLGTKKFMDFEL